MTRNVLNYYDFRGLGIVKVLYYYNFQIQGYLIYDSSIISEV